MMKVNLLEDKSTRMKINWNEVFITLIIIIICLSLFGHFYGLYKQKTILNQQINILNQRIEYYQPRVNRFQNLNEEIEKLKKIENITWIRYMQANALDDLSYIVPAKLTIKEIIIEKGLVKMSGYALDNDNIVTLLDNLKLSPYFREASLNQLQSGQDIKFEIETEIISKGG